MPKIFISYRRDDSGYAADRIYEKLAHKFDLFFDVHGIPLGVDWKEYLTTNVQECAVMLVIIGRDWLDMIEQRSSRQDDFVRFEIETALNRGIPIIPLFLDGMTGIPEDRLPTTIVQLAARQGMQIRRAPDFDGDVARLIAGIEGLLATKPQVSKILKADIGNILPPPFAWIDIPAGSVTLQQTYEADTYLKNGESRRFHVAAFAISKYPVTIGQFQIFVDAKDGYRNSAWWDYSAEAKAWRAKNSKPQNPDWEVEDHPRFSVCWYEAVAFCRWLGANLNADIRLPTEQEWQRAAQGDTNWAYPWGDEWDGSRCNNSAGSINYSTSSVTAYEGRGDSPFGVVDLSGNVWEWCATKFDNGQQDLNGANVRVLRGGCWDDDTAEFFETDYRFSYRPDYWYFFGFRCAFT